MKNHFFNVARIYIPLAVAVSVMSILVYVAVQQNFRQNANDPQVQMAEDASVTLAQNNIPASIVPRGQVVEISRSLAPFIMVVEKNGNVLESDATLDGQAIKIPAGLFDETANSGGQYRVTWQPEPNVRQALVIQSVPNSDQFVVAGRSLREAEHRTELLGWYVLAAWLGTLVITLILLIGIEALSAFKAE